MTEELSPRYEPDQVEERIYAMWEQAGAFTPPAKPSGEAFSVATPPPNVTGALHMGHALNNTVQDIVVRYQRKQGKDTLWLPGTDHAGIATQAVVEKKLFKEENKTRTEMGREAFLEKVWEWKETYGNRILHQLKRMGCSCDWSRTAFTMDEDLSRAVREAFVRLWEKNLIYRGARMVNWDCVLKTAVSDDEIEHVERKSKLWHLRYPVEGQDGRFVVVATTRPETMLGDTGVGVHPDDERYADLVGKNLRLPLMDRSIPVVADDTVDRDFGTGAVKLTPGHDPADYERGQRAGLPIINVLTEDGRINENGGPYAGLSREQARKRVVDDLEKQGLLEKIVPHVHSVAISDRSGSAIEPIVSEQWFVRMEQLAVPAIAAVKNGSLRFIPERWTKVYLSWLENVRDWCISRQLWWGHRIPVWYDEDDVPIAAREDLEIGAPHPRTGKPIVRQDEDVMDTWASSWLWPFATLGWPRESADLERFYPTQFLATARDIIYLWVARMVMASYEFVDGLPAERRSPFAICYINATVLDGKGRRMSKSLGNGIDPLDLIESFGADAMRLSLTLLTAEGQDIRFSEKRVEEARNFINKLWNAARFVLGALPDEELSVDFSKARRLEDRWILHRLALLTEETEARYEGCKFLDAAQALRRFTWNDFCDWYLEIAKVRFLDSSDAESRTMAQAITARVLVQVLHLLHPIVPFVSEAIFQHVRKRRFAACDQDLILAPWPSHEDLPRHELAARHMTAIQDLVSSLRNLRARNGVSERKEVDAALKLPGADLQVALEEARPWFERLSRCHLLEATTTAVRPPDSDVDVITVDPFGTAEVYLPLGDLIDKAARAEDLRSKLQKQEQQLAQVVNRLQNDSFVQRAPDAVVQKERDKQAALEQERDKLRQALEDLGVE